MRAVGLESPGCGMRSVPLRMSAADSPRSGFRALCDSSICQKAMCRLSGDQFHACASPNSSSYTQSNWPLKTCSVASLVSALVLRREIDDVHVAAALLAEHGAVRRELGRPAPCAASCSEWSRGNRCRSRRCPTGDRAAGSWSGRRDVSILGELERLVGERCRGVGKGHALGGEQEGIARRSPGRWPGSPRHSRPGWCRKSASRRRSSSRCGVPSVPTSRPRPGAPRSGS